jgi:hypothetical protein
MKVGSIGPGTPGKTWDHPALVRALELLGGHAIGAKA